MNNNNFSIKPNNIYVYFRVSTYSQTYKTNGLEEQNNICQNYLNFNFSNFDGDIEFYTDVASSYNNKNILTNLNKIIRKITSQTNSLLIVRDISRLGRDTFQVFNLLKKIKKSKSYIIGIEENLCYNYSKLMDRKFSHIIIDSEEHSDNKSIKSSNRINNILINGGYVGRVPFGCMIIKKNNIPYIYKNPDEINTLKMIKEIFLKYKSILKTMDYLNSNNIKYRNDIKWNESIIKNYLKKYFPNLLKNNDSDLIDFYFSKYSDYDKTIEIINFNNKFMNLKIKNIVGAKPKRKYVKFT